jgi:hydrogenase expression/formation protein HypD
LRASITRGMGSSKRWPRATAPATAGPAVGGIIPENLTIINVHRLTPPIMRFTFETHRDNPIRGVIAPGHVSTIVGARAW